MRNARLAILLLLVLPAYAQEKLADYIKANYTKYEHRIEMRDGARLFTSVYTPKDTTEDYPIILMRTPYSCRPYGVDQYKTRLGPSGKLDREGYIYVFQDVRGRYMSEGEYVHVRPHIADKQGPQDVDESSDTYDTIDWLVKHLPNNNGRVGIWGISYPGFYAAASLPDAHPALKAVSPQAPVTDWFIGDDFHHNGAFFLAHAFRFFINFDRIRPGPEKDEGRPRFDYKTPNGYEFFLQFQNAADVAVKYDERQLPFWRQMMEHPNYDDFWKSRLILPHLTEITPAVMTVGGWFDAEDVWGPVNVYKAIEKQSPGAVNIVVYGPWSHGGWSRGDGAHLGDVPFNAKTGEFYREQMIEPFFRYHLKQEGEMDLPEAFMFETGTNVWRRYDQWPPAGTPKKLYFHSNGKLSADAPRERGAFDEYTSDPDKPVPHMGTTVRDMPIEYMVADQRFAASRTDVLVYETDVLEEDVTIGGTFTASLKVEVTGTDADFIVKLIDVYPPDFPDPDPNPAKVRMGTYQQLVRGEPIRGRFRNSWGKPEPFEPGKVTTVEFELPDILHTFRREHKIMVQVQSTWFPLVDRNPQKYVDIYHAKPEDFQKADHRVYRSPQHPSYIEVTEIP